MSVQRLWVLLGVALLLCAMSPEAALARSRKSASVSRGHGKSSHGKSSRGPRRKKKQRSYRPPEMPSSIEFQSFDLVTGQGQLIVVGTKHVPEIRLLVLSDDRGRRFVPDMADCQPPVGVELPAEGSDPALVPANLRWRCTFSVPTLYRKAALIGVAMEWGDKSVEVASQKVATVYAAAAKSVPSAPRPREDGIQAPRPQPLPGADEGGDPEDSEAHEDDGGESDDSPH